MVDRERTAQPPKDLFTGTGPLLRKAEKYRGASCISHLFNTQHWGMDLRVGHTEDEKILPPPAHLITRYQEKFEPTLGTIPASPILFGAISHISNLREQIV